MKTLRLISLCLSLAWLSCTGCSQKDNAAPAQTESSGMRTGQNGHTASDTATDSAAQNTVVYICKSAAAKRFHYDENCRGLQRCTHEIEKTTQWKAEAIGLTMCRYEE